MLSSGKLKAVGFSGPFHCYFNLVSVSVLGFQAIQAILSMHVVVNMTK